MLFLTGQINDLSNEDLKRNLILWPQQVEKMMEEQRAWVAYSQNVLYPLWLEYIALRQLKETFTFRGNNLKRAGHNI